DDDADQAEKVSKEKLQKEAEIRRLKEEDAELMERKQKLQLRDDDADQAEKVSKEKLLKEEDDELMERKQKLQLRVQRRSVYQDFMEQVVKMTKITKDFPYRQTIEQILNNNKDPDVELAEKNYECLKRMSKELQQIQQSNDVLLQEQLPRRSQNQFRPQPPQTKDVRDGTEHELGQSSPLNHT
ncbi:hypothetical protein GBF38_000225, partial [Nibea albiflora]